MIYLWLSFCRHDIKQSRQIKGEWFAGPLEEGKPLLIPICSDLGSFPFVESHEIFYSRPGSLFNIVLVLAGDGILKFHGPHSGGWAGILHPISTLLLSPELCWMRGKNKVSRRNIRIQLLSCCQLSSKCSIKLKILKPTPPNHTIPEKFNSAGIRR